MNWTAPSEKDADSVSLEKRLWDAADQFRANSGLKAQLETLNEELETLNAAAHKLEKTIAANVAEIVET